MSFVPIIRPGGVTTPGGTPITVVTVPGTGAAPPPSAPDFPGNVTTVDYASALAETSRTPIYQAVISKAVASANAYWTLDEASGTRLDSIGLNHLTSVNNVGQATGHTATAAQFNSASSRYLTCNPVHSLLHGGRSFTVTCWVYLDSKTVDMAICGQYGTVVGNRSWVLQYRQSIDRFRFVTNNGAGVETSVAADAFGSPSTGVFYFIEAIYSKTTPGSEAVYISVNGGARNNAASTPPAIITQAFEVGRVNNTDYFDGRIDDLRFFKRVLTDDERAATYAGSIGLGTIYEFSSAHPSNRDEIGLEVLIPLKLNQRADIEQCRFPLSTLTFGLVSDGDGAVRAAITAGIIGSQIDFYMSFWELPWEANKRLRFHGVISEIEQTAGIYQVTALSPVAAANDAKVFDGAQTQLSSAITDTAVTIPVVDTSAFAEPNSDINQTYPVLTGDEFWFPLGRTATSFTSVQRVGANIYAIPPIMPNSQSTGHAAGVAVREMVELGQLTATNGDSGANDLHPMDLLIAFLTGSEEKASLNSGLVMVNTAQLNAAETTLGTGLKFKFSLDEAINAKTFAEKELYLAVAGYPRENTAGQLGIKLYQDAASAVISDTIEDKDIVEWPHWLRNAEKIINVVIVYYDYNPISREFTSTFEYRDETLISQYGERVLIIESKGIRSQYTQTAPTTITWFGSTGAFLLAMCQRQVARFGGKAPVFSVTTLLTKQLLSVGDDVECTFSLVPDIDTGQVGITFKKCEIQAMLHDFQANTIEMELLAYPE